MKNHYLSKNLSQGFIYLYTGKMIANIAYSISSLFLPIFLYKIFDFEIKYVLYYYLVSSLIYIFLVAFGAKFLNKVGFRNSLRASVFLGALFYLSFYFINENNAKYFILFPILIITFYRLSYWLPYHIDFAKFTDKKNRGKEFSILQSTRLMVGIISPLLIGFIVGSVNFKTMFVFGAIVYLLSGIPYLKITRTKEKFSWGYFQTWGNFFNKKYKKIVFAYMADGAEQVVGIIIWPIFIWKLLDGNLFKVGAISSLIVAFSIILQLMIGRYTDKMNKEKILRFGSILYSLGWIIKIFVATAFQIFITSTYHNLTKIFMRTPFDVLTYEKAADSGHYVDEFTVIHEMALNFGKVLMLILVLAVSSFFSIQWTFILAALSALFFNFL
ncbi:MAG: MFS transporter [Xanthomonadaceae bacterium]|nr:MFS transporter [Rhodospirillaceae bacterium]NIA17794.1 MFS transporter [Xanthomonadaceae bacterium]